MPVVTRISGRAGQVFKLIGVLTMYRGKDTIGKIVEEKGGSVIRQPCREGQLNTALTKL